MSSLTSASGDQASVSSGNNPQQYVASSAQAQPVKEKRSLPRNPDPDAEVVALSPKTLLAANRFVCEICNKGFQREQNLQLHRRGHNLPWKLKQRTSKEVKKKVYVCPEPTCVHHDPSLALGDLTGIKKHYYRKHGEKKWKCDKCSKRYAVQSDWKAHSKTCGTREYKCDCGTLFSRRDSFITHRAFCGALAEECARAIPGGAPNPLLTTSQLPSGSSLSVNLQFPHQQFTSTHQDHHLHAFSLKKEPQQQQHTFTSTPLRPELPPWLACPPGGVILGPGPGPPQPNIDLTSPNSSSSSRLGHQEFTHPHHDQLNPNPTGTANPGATNLLPPYPSSTTSPHMSATSLLQKAAQMGATICSKSTVRAPGLLIPHHHHRQQQQQVHHGFASLSHNGGNIKTGPSAFVSRVLKKDGGLGDSLSVSNQAFGGNSRSGGGGSDGLTRNFLGLRPVSQSDILNIPAGLGSCVNTSSHEQNTQSQKPCVDSKEDWSGSAIVDEDNMDKGEEILISTEVVPVGDLLAAGIVMPVRKTFVPLSSGFTKRSGRSKFASRPSKTAKSALKSLPVIPDNGSVVMDDAQVMHEVDISAMSNVFLKEGFNIDNENTSGRCGDHRSEFNFSGENEIWDDNMLIEEGFDGKVKNLSNSRQDLTTFNTLVSLGCSIPEIPLQYLRKLVDLLLDAYPSKSLALNLHAECLVELNLSCGNDAKLQNLVNLKLIGLSNSNFTRLPDLSGACKLQHLDLQGCANLVEVSSIQYLNKLEYLNLKGCTSLRSLLSVVALKCLSSLDLSDCTNLRRLPASIGCLPSLAILDIRNCRRIQNLPIGTIRLKSLQRFSISGCPRLMKHMSRVGMSSSVDHETPSGFDGMPVELQKNQMVLCSSLDGGIYPKEKQLEYLSSTSVSEPSSQRTQVEVLSHAEVSSLNQPVSKHNSKRSLQRPKEEGNSNKPNSEGKPSLKRKTSYAMESTGSENAVNPSSPAQNLQRIPTHPRISWPSLSGDNSNVTLGSDLLQQEREALKGYMNMSVEAIHLADAFEDVERIAETLIQQSSNMHEKADLEDLLYCLGELQESVPDTLGHMNDAQTYRTSLQVKLVHLALSSVQAEEQYRLLAAKFATLSEEEEKLEAEIQRLMADKAESINAENQIVSPSYTM